MQMKAPDITVGIVSARTIHFTFHGNYTSDCGLLAVSDEEVVATDTAISWRGNLYHELLFTPESSADDSFSLYDVIIGVDFHWERKEVQTFRGALRLVNDKGRVCAINILPLEDYLQSVISSEMSSRASLNLLKAHAVISRSWLMAQLQRKSSTQIDRSSEVHNGISFADRMIVRWYDRDDHKLFDVCADDHCQRYQGITKISNPTAVEAVLQTNGQILTYNNKICDARFSKCCGGILEVYSSCWEDKNEPYLVSKPDIIHDARARDVIDAFCNTSDPSILSEVLNDFDQETHDFYRWTVEYTQDELDRLVRQRSGIDFGSIISMTPVRRGPSGRIILLEIQGTRKSVIVGKELEIRKWLSSSHLYSSAFEVIKTSNGFRLEGRGWGHGVGLCQIGAAVMGNLGYDYREILTHYYPNAEISCLY